MNNTRVGIYVRVSTKEQAVEGYSIGEQTERLTKFAESQAWQIVRVYTDAGFSGSNTNRPSLRQLVEDVKEHKVNKILVYKLDRLSRSQKDTLRLIEDVFLKNDCDFESMTEKLDTGTPHGRAMIGILAAFAQLEREQIKERMMLGHEARAKQGKWRGGGTPPYGYTYNAGSGFLEVVPEEAEVVKMVFRRFVSGTSINTLRKEMGKTRKGMITMLSNVTYTGYLPHKETAFESEHSAIIDTDTFEKAQAILQENARRWRELKSSATRENPTTLLSGMLFCARCGAKYCKVTYSNHRSYYACCSRAKKSLQMVKDPSCRNDNWRIEKLDQMIIDEIAKLKIDSKRPVKKDHDQVKEISLLNKRIEEITKQINRLMDLYTIGTIDVNEITKRIEPLETERKTLKESVNNIAFKPKQQKNIKKLVQTFAQALEKGDLKQKRIIIQQLIDHIDLDGENITIHWNF